MKKIIIAILLLPVALGIAWIVSNQNKINMYSTELVELKKVTNEIWIHESKQMIEGKIYPSNGLIVITNSGLVMIDTPWNDLQTQDLIELSERTFNKKVISAIITHSHSDRMGGINQLISKDIEIIISRKTTELAKNEGYPNLLGYEENELVKDIGSTEFDIFYPGEAHSTDNMVVWLPKYEVLFAGCMVKEASAITVGNVSDVNLEEWGHSLERLVTKFPNAKIVIPGHGAMGNIELIDHTMNLLN